MRGLKIVAPMILHKAWTPIDLRDFVGQRGIVRAIPRFVETVLPVEGGLVEVRKNQDTPTVRGMTVVVDDISGRK